jgi:hypothetical protein
MSDGIPAGVTITDDAVVINGTNRPLSEILRAEASEVEDLLRILVLLAVALFAPILVMIVFAVAGGSESLHFWFGPVTLVLTCLFGLIGCGLGIAWPKPWGVVVDRGEFGFGRLMRCSSKDEAERIASEINAVVVKD